MSIPTAGWQAKVFYAILWIYQLFKRKKGGE